MPATRNLGPGVRPAWTAHPAHGSAAGRMRRASALVALVAMGSVVPAQLQPDSLPRPGGAVGGPVRDEVSAGRVDALAAAGRSRLAEDDLLAAQRVFRSLRSVAPDSIAGSLGLGEVYLRIGRPELSLRYARAAQEAVPTDPRGAALEVQALCRLRRFELAVVVAQDAMDRFRPDPGVELAAAYASSLFRVQRIDEAAQAYRRVLQLDPGHAEAHLRLGSGLHAPVRLDLVDDSLLARGVAATKAGRLGVAIALFRDRLKTRGRHPVAHRLLGEALQLREAEQSLAMRSPAFQRLADALPTPRIDADPVGRFVPAYDSLTAERRLVVDRALAPFASYLPRLITMGGRHDLLDELERTTDAAARSRLRGSRTFDGRVWDDVRGIGGLRAATGIEALDEPRVFGFDTLAHEAAHQAHLFGFKRVDRLRIRDLYKSARSEGRFLDYYAASNEAEYFAQGVEAFVSYGKRPGREPTHGHTRFELFRRDPALHGFIARIVDFDPLRDPIARREILTAAIDVALVSGRPEDALVAAQMLPAGDLRTRRIAEARRAVRFARSY